jgi:four helix bundle protein
MAGVERFEDLIAWQKARVFAAEIYRITASGAFQQDWGLRDQIRRASVSIMSNIAEGFERRSPNDFQRFLMIAKASCAEVRSQLYVSKDIGYLTEPEFQMLMNSGTELSRIIGALRRSVYNRK